MNKLVYNTKTKSFSTKTFSDWDQIRDLVRNTYPRIKFEKVRNSDDGKSYKVKMISNGRERIIEIPINGKSAIDNFEKASRMKVENNLRKDINDPKVKDDLKHYKISKSGINKRFLKPTDLTNEEKDELISQVSNLAETDPKALVEYVNLGTPNLNVFMRVPMSESAALNVLKELQDAEIDITHSTFRNAKGSVLATLAAYNLTTPGVGDRYYEYGIIPSRSSSLSTEKIHEIVENGSADWQARSELLRNPNISEDDLRALYDKDKAKVVGNKNCPKDLIDRFFRSDLSKVSDDDLKRVCGSPNLSVDQMGKLLDTKLQYIDQYIARSPSFNHEILNRWLEGYDQYRKWEQENPDATYYVKENKKRQLGLTGGLNVAASPESSASKSDYNLAIAAIDAPTNPDYEYTYDGETRQIKGDKSILARINDPRYDQAYQDFAKSLKDIYDDPNYRWRNMLHELYPTFTKLLLAFDPSESYKVSPELLGKKCYEKLEKLDSGEKVSKKFTPEDFDGKSKNAPKTAEELGVEQKDIDRASECNSESKSANMAKKITDPEKLFRRAKAFISNTKFNPTPWINRAKELNLPEDKIKELESLIDSRTYSVPTRKGLTYNTKTKSFSGSNRLVIVYDEVDNLYHIVKKGTEGKYLDKSIGNFVLNREYNSREEAEKDLGVDDNTVTKVGKAYRPN